MLVLSMRDFELFSREEPDAKVNKLNRSTFQLINFFFFTREFVCTCTGTLLDRFSQQAIRIHVFFFRNKSTSLRTMAARLSLKALVRDGCMMLVGVLLGFLLTQMFIGNPMRNIAELCNSERVAHITKRFSSSQSNNLYKHEARKKGKL